MIGLMDMMVVGCLMGLVVIVIVYYLNERDFRQKRYLIDYVINNCVEIRNNKNMSKQYENKLVFVSGQISECNPIVDGVY